MAMLMQQRQIQLIGPPMRIGTCLFWFVSVCDRAFRFIVHSSSVVWAIDSGIEVFRMGGRMIANQSSQFFIGAQISVDTDASCIVFARRTYATGYFLDQY
jgi:hypothetical protein